MVSRPAPIRRHGRRGSEERKGVHGCTAPALAIDDRRAVLVWVTCGSWKQRHVPYNLLIISAHNLADASNNPHYCSHLQIFSRSETQQLFNDAARGHNDRARQLGVHEKRRLSAHAFWRTCRCGHDRLSNQDRFQSREHSGRHDHGQQGVRPPHPRLINNFPPVLTNNFNFNFFKCTHTGPRCSSHTQKSSVRSSQPYITPLPTSAGRPPSQPRSR